METNLNLSTKINKRNQIELIYQESNPLHPNNQICSESQIYRKLSQTWPNSTSYQPKQQEIKRSDKKERRNRRSPSKSTEITNPRRQICLEFTLDVESVNPAKNMN